MPECDTMDLCYIRENPEGVKNVYRLALIQFSSLEPWGGCLSYWVT